MPTPVQPSLFGDLPAEKESDSSVSLGKRAVGDSDSSSDLSTKRPKFG